MSSLEARQCLKEVQAIDALLGELRHGQASSIALGLSLQDVTPGKVPAPPREDAAPVGKGVTRPTPTGFKDMLATVMGRANLLVRGQQRELTALDTLGDVIARDLASVAAGKEPPKLNGPSLQEISKPLSELQDKRRPKVEVITPELEAGGDAASDDGGEEAAGGEALPADTRSGVAETKADPEADAATAATAGDADDMSMSALEAHLRAYRPRRKYVNGNGSTQANFKDRLLKEIGRLDAAVYMKYNRETSAKGDGKEVGAVRPWDAALVLRAWDWGSFAATKVGEGKLTILGRKLVLCASHDPDAPSSTANTAAHANLMDRLKGMAEDPFLHTANGEDPTRLQEVLITQLIALERLTSDAPPDPRFTLLITHYPFLPSAPQGSNEMDSADRTEALMAQAKDGEETKVDASTFELRDIVSPTSTVVAVADSGGGAQKLVPRPWQMAWRASMLPVIRDTRHREAAKSEMAAPLPDIEDKNCLQKCFQKVADSFPELRLGAVLDPVCGLSCCAPPDVYRQVAGETMDRRRAGRDELYPKEGADKPKEATEFDALLPKSPRVQQVRDVSRTVNRTVNRKKATDAELSASINLEMLYRHLHMEMVVVRQLRTMYRRSLYVEKDYAEICRRPGALPLSEQYRQLGLDPDEFSASVDRVSTDAHQFVMTTGQLLYVRRPLLKAALLLRIDGMGAWFANHEFLKQKVEPVQVKILGTRRYYWEVTNVEQRDIAVRALLLKATLRYHVVRGDIRYEKHCVAPGETAGKKQHPTEQIGLKPVERRGWITDTKYVLKHCVPFKKCRFVRSKPNNLARDALQSHTLQASQQDNSFKASRETTPTVFLIRARTEGLKRTAAGCGYLLQTIDNHLDASQQPHFRVGARPDQLEVGANASGVRKASDWCHRWLEHPAIDPTLHELSHRQAVKRLWWYRIHTAPYLPYSPVGAMQALWRRYRVADDYAPTSSSDSGWSVTPPVEDAVTTSGTEKFPSRCLDADDAAHREHLDSMFSPADRGRLLWRMFANDAGLWPDGHAPHVDLERLPQVQGLLPPSSASLRQTEHDEQTPPDLDFQYPVDGGAGYSRFDYLNPELQMLHSPEHLRDLHTVWNRTKTSHFFDGAGTMFVNGVKAYFGEGQAYLTALHRNVHKSILGMAAFILVAQVLAFATGLSSSGTSTSADKERLYNFMIGVSVVIFWSAGQQESWLRTQAKMLALWGLPVLSSTDMELTLTDVAKEHDGLIANSTEEVVRTTVVQVVEDDGWDDDPDGRGEQVDRGTPAPTSTGLDFGRAGAPMETARGERAIVHKTKKRVLLTVHPWYTKEVKLFHWVQILLLLLNSAGIVWVLLQVAALFTNNARGIAWLAGTALLVTVTMMGTRFIFTSLRDKEVFHTQRAFTSAGLYWGLVTMAAIFLFGMSSMVVWQQVLNSPGRSAGDHVASFLLAGILIACVFLGFAVRWYMLFWGKRVLRGNCLQSTKSVAAAFGRTLGFMFCNIPLRPLCLLFFMWPCCCWRTRTGFRGFGFSTKMWGWFAAKPRAEGEPDVPTYVRVLAHVLAGSVLGGVAALATYVATVDATGGTHSAAKDGGVGLAVAGVYLVHEYYMSGRNFPLGPSPTDMERSYTRFDEEHDIARALFVQLVTHFGYPVYLLLLDRLSAALTLCPETTVGEALDVNCYTGAGNFLVVINVFVFLVDFLLLLFTSKGDGWRDPSSLYALCMPCNRYRKEYVEPWVNRFIRWRFLTFKPASVAEPIVERADELEYTSGDPTQHVEGPYGTPHVSNWSNKEDVKPVLAQWHLAGVVANTRAALLQLFGTQDLLGMRVVHRKQKEKREPFAPGEGNCLTHVMEEANASCIWDPRFCKLFWKCKCCNRAENVQVSRLMVFIRAMAFVSAVRGRVLHNRRRRKRVFKLPPQGWLFSGSVVMPEQGTLRRLRRVPIGGGGGELTPLPRVVSTVYIGAEPYDLEPGASTTEVIALTKDFVPPADGFKGDDQDLSAVKLHFFPEEVIHAKDDSLKRALPDLDRVWSYRFHADDHVEPPGFFNQKNVLPRESIDINAPMPGHLLQHTTLPLNRRRVFHNANAITDLLFIYANVIASTFFSLIYVFLATALLTYIKESTEASMLHHERRPYPRRLLALHWPKFTRIVLAVFCFINVTAFIFTPNSSIALDPDENTWTQSLSLAAYSTIILLFVRKLFMILLAKTNFMVSVFAQRPVKRAQELSFYHHGVQQQANAALIHSFDTKMAETHDKDSPSSIPKPQITALSNEFTALTQSVRDLGYSLF